MRMEQISLLNVIEKTWEMIEYSKNVDKIKNKYDENASTYVLQHNNVVMDLSPRSDLFIGQTVLQNTLPFWQCAAIRLINLFVIGIRHRIVYNRHFKHAAHG